MHDAFAYQADTIVVDTDDGWQLPAVSRTPTGELTVQVMHDGTYHRRTPDLATTACGIPLHSQFSPVRREVLRHPLSRDCGCFTAFELAKADAIWADENP